MSERQPIDVRVIKRVEYRFVNGEWCEVKYRRALQGGRMYVSWGPYGPRHPQLEWCDQEYLAPVTDEAVLANLRSKSAE